MIQARWRLEHLSQHQHGQPQQPKVLAAWKLHEVSNFLGHTCFENEEKTVNSGIAVSTKVKEKAPRSHQNQPDLVTFTRELLKKRARIHFDQAPSNCEAAAEVMQTSVDYPSSPVLAASSLRTRDQSVWTGQKLFILLRYFGNS